GAQQAQAMEVQNIECENPHEKLRAPKVEVESYPRLIEAILILSEQKIFNKVFFESNSNGFIVDKTEGCSFKKRLEEKFLRDIKKTSSGGFRAAAYFFLHCYKQRISSEARNAITKNVAALLEKRDIKQQDRSHTLSTGSPEAQQLCRREKFKNEISDIHMQNHQEKILHDLFELRGRFYAHFNTPEPLHFYKCATSSTELGPISRNQSICIFGQSFDNRQAQGKMYREYKKFYSKLSQLGTKSKRRSPI
ncbi:hypothetical protein BB561_003060, partial [Smittium simulii]